MIKVGLGVVKVQIRMVSGGKGIFFDLGGTVGNNVIPDYEMLSAKCTFRSPTKVFRLVLSKTIKINLKSSF